MILHIFRAWRNFVLYLLFLLVAILYLVLCG
jgi:hypothetical protein